MLLVFVDDATGKLMELRFCRSESTFEYWTSVRRYLERHGRPVAFYSDKATVFRVNRKQDHGGTGITQFGRVSNGILLVDDANVRMMDGQSKLDAIIGAARSRFVPIVMTSLATVIGLLPTALGLEAGTESNRPLALAVVGGLTSSTLLSLFLIPVMFMLFASERVAKADEDERVPEITGGQAAAASG